MDVFVVGDVAACIIAGRLSLNIASGTIPRTKDGAGLLKHVHLFTDLKMQSFEGALLAPEFISVHSNTDDHLKTSKIVILADGTRDLEWLKKQRTHPSVAVVQLCTKVRQPSDESDKEPLNHASTNVIQGAITVSGTISSIGDVRATTMGGLMLSRLRRDQKHLEYVLQCMETTGLHVVYRGYQQLTNWSFGDITWKLFHGYWIVQYGSDYKVTFYEGLGDSETRLFYFVLLEESLKILKQDQVQLVSAAPSPLGLPLRMCMHLLRFPDFWFRLFLPFIMIPQYGFAWSNVAIFKGDPSMVLLSNAYVSRMALQLYVDTPANSLFASKVQKGISKMSADEIKMCNLPQLYAHKSVFACVLIVTLIIFKVIPYFLRQFWHAVIM